MLFKKLKKLTGINAKSKLVDLNIGPIKNEVDNKIMTDKNIINQ